jgi:hypothetical protein
MPTLSECDQGLVAITVQTAMSGGGESRHVMHSETESSATWLSANAVLRRTIVPKNHRIVAVLRGGLISLWLYKENTKLRG